MKFIEPSVTLLKKPYDQTNEAEVLKYIERIGRVCYRSEDKITEDSAAKFYNMIKSRGHWAMLEHYLFEIYTDHETSGSVFYWNGKCSPFIEVFSVPVFNIIQNIRTDACELVPLFRNNKTGSVSKIIFSPRAYLEWYQKFDWKSPLMNDDVKKRIDRFNYALWKTWPTIFADQKPEREFSDSDIKDYIFIPDGLPFQTTNYWCSMEFVTDRGCCYDDQTRVLTKNGWKFFKDVTASDVFYTLDENRDIQYTKASSIICQKYEGPMHHYHSTQIDLMVTPNHNMWVYDYDKRSVVTKKWKFMESRQMKNGRYKFDKSANPIDAASKPVIIPAVNIRRGFRGYVEYPELTLDPNPFYELLGYWLTDGCISFGKRDRGNRITISQIKKWHRDRIRELILELNFDYYEDPKEFRINSPQLFSYLVKNFIKSIDDTRKTYYLKLPRNFIDELSKDDIDCLMKGIIAGNGTPHTRGKGFQIYTASPDFAMDLVELCLRSGMAANIYRIPPRYRKFPGRDTVTECQEQFVVSVVSTGITLWTRNNSQKSYFEEVPYNGYVYCVELPVHHRLYVMRSGKSCWCGNSHEIVRHRIASYAQESTRYCNYSKDKFGTELTFIKRDWDDKQLGQYDQIHVYENLLREAEHAYMFMVRNNVPAQIARSVLPNQLATKIVMTAKYDEWLHFFKMRCASDAHPDMQVVAKKAQDLFYVYICGRTMDQLREERERLEKNGFTVANGLKYQSEKTDTGTTCTVISKSEE